jgi:hypothetical protein
MRVEARNPYGGGRFCTFDPLVMIVCFVKNTFLVFKAANLNWLVLGGKLYLSFPFRKESLVEVSNFCGFMQYRYLLKRAWKLLWRLCSNSSVELRT